MTISESCHLQDLLRKCPGCGHQASSTKFLYQGSPAPGPLTSIYLGPVRNGPHSRRWAVGRLSKLHLYLQSLPITPITAWAQPSVRSAAALDSHKDANPTVNCACKWSRLCAPYENLMPDDLRWSWGSDASAGEQLQIQIIISREVWLHRDHNKSIACRLIAKPYQWAASDKLHLVGFTVASELMYFNCAAASGGRL